MMDFNTARHLMVEGQIRPNKVVNEPLLAAMNYIPREVFVPAAMQTIAYAETEIKLAGGRQMLAPMLLARMIEALHLTENANVLDVAPATGYSTALLALCAYTVDAVEPDTELAAAAVMNMQKLSITNMHVVAGSAAAPNLTASYDAILIAGLMNKVPAAYTNALREGGRMAVILMKDGVPNATLVTKQNGVLQSHDLFEAYAAYVPATAPAESFVF